MFINIGICNIMYGYKYVNIDIICLEGVVNYCNDGL